MKKSKKLAALLTLFTALVGPSLFADKRHEKTTNDWRDHSWETRRVVVEGRIRDIDRERNGFVIRLNRGKVLFAPAQVRGVRALDRGDFVRVRGREDRRGRIYVDDIRLVRNDRHRDRNRYDRSLSGVVQRVDRRGDMVWVEELRTRRVVAIDMRRIERNHRQYDPDELRRGDRITVRGEWHRDGRFEAEHLDVDRGAWW